MSSPNSGGDYATISQTEAVLSKEFTDQVKVAVPGLKDSGQTKEPIRG
jgi:hypothetical protein